MMTSLWKGEFSQLLSFLEFLIFRYRWEVTVFRQIERYCIKLVYRARPAVALSDLAEGVRVSRSPLCLNVLKE